MFGRAGYNFEDPECFFANSAIHTCGPGTALWTGGREAYDAYIRATKQAGGACKDWGELSSGAKAAPDTEW